MTDYFYTGMPFVMRKENDGQPYHLTQGDPGGATSWGVTFATWITWQRLHREPATLEAFKVQTQTDMYPIYRALYWNANRCGNMGPFGISVFDVSVMSGPARGAKILQTLLGVEVDGQIGPLTIAAFNQVPDQLQLNKDYYDARIVFYQSLKGVSQFLHGWTRRADDCKTLVDSLLQTDAPETT